MKKRWLFIASLSIALICSFISCTSPNNNKNTSTIVGTWKLATIQGVPVSLLTNTSGSIVVATDMTCTAQMTLNGTTAGSTITGTVTDKGASIYAFAYTGDTSTYDGTLSSDGKTLSFASYSIFGAVTYTK